MTGLTWDHPDSDPMGDLLAAKRKLDAYRPAAERTLARLNVAGSMLDRIRQALPTPPRFLAPATPPSDLFGCPIIVDQDVPEDEIHLTYGDGRVEVIKIP